jgi:hypothetical protein
MNTIHGLYRSYQNNSTKPSIVVQAYLDEIERLNPRPWCISGHMGRYSIGNGGGGG